MSAEVNELASAVANIAGNGKLVRRNVHSAECDNRVGDATGQVKYVLGFYNIDLPGARHPNAFKLVQKHWRDLGWKITDDRFRQELNEGVLSAKDPRAGIDFTLSSTTSPDALAILISSGCFREAQPMT
ncbi:hypothetical protein [Krasilnikovia sp. M28-CT-15]|uniref:hypothetical protein n=1 Tax=Krasilnikovia sp. M28-CT-15 TaxID=3373540 RepID=UPI00399CA4DD